MGVGERPTFIVVGYLHVPVQINESAEFLENAKGHVHAFLTP